MAGLRQRTQIVRQQVGLETEPAVAQFTAAVLIGDGVGIEELQCRRLDARVDL